jgi:hypothetical protein
VKELKAFCSLNDYFGDAHFQSKELGPAALRQLLIFLRATAARVYFPKYSNVVRKNLSTAQFGFLQFFMGHDPRS